MRLAERSLPKKNPAARGAEVGLKYCTVKEAVPAFFGSTAGNVLVLADEAAFPALAFAARMPRAVGFVGGDALPLFAVAEGAGVVAAGGENVLRAARLYASLHRTPCLLFPAQCTLGGAFERTGALVNGSFFDHPLADAQVCIDETLLAPSRAEGYARLLLCRLALFERRALFRFNGGPEPCDDAFSVLSELGDPPDLREIVEKNAALRRMDAEEGEGKFLAETHGFFAAFEALTALYVAFFRCGEARRYLVADYAARARAANIPFAKMRIPTQEDYTRRALVLGGRRTEFLRELELITRKNATYRRVYRSLGGEIGSVPVEELNFLPERAIGLSAVIRDFGLLEKL